MCICKQYCHRLPKWETPIQSHLIQVTPHDRAIRVVCQFFMNIANSCNSSFHFVWWKNVVSPVPGESYSLMMGSGNSGTEHQHNYITTQIYILYVPFWSIQIFEMCCAIQVKFQDTGKQPEKHRLKVVVSSEIIPTRCNNCVYSSQWLYSTCFGWQSHPSSGLQCCIWPFR